ncbi:restriction endonuclease subunit S [Aliarcobacter skirrowii]|uniref:restriction endonuclease subunit S n=1 Tax=Aliarcobacter skirrowii TaxID=28200 RepID=UPI000825E208|nr:restriction endonuclease subunit S [Aliarcobacter skirrowii]
MSKSINVPKLRFKEFSGVWEDKLIGQILTVGSGKDYKHLSNGDIPVYGTGGYMLSVNDYLYDGESVGIGRKGTIDKPIFLTGKFWTVDTLFYTHSFKNSVPKFIYSIFQRINWKLYNEASGVPSLSKSTIEKIKIFIPSKHEQEKIASFLTSVDTKIEQLTKKEQLLQQYKKSVMQKIFNQEIRFKDDDGSEFCEWEEKKLGDICKLQGGFAFKSEQFRKSGIPVIRISNISNINNYIDRENIVYYDAIPNDRNFSITNGDLIVAMSGATTGKASIYNLNEKAYLNQRVGLFRANKDKLYYGYLVQFVFSKLFYRQLDTVLVAGAQPNISSKDIEDFKFNLPCLKEQIKIANFLSSIDSKIEQVQQHLNSTKEFKKALLQQMFV